MFVINHNFMDYDVDGIIIPRLKTIAVTDDELDKLKKSFMIKEFVRLGQIEFSEKEPEGFKTDAQRAEEAVTVINDKDKEIADLKSQLAAKDKEMEELKAEALAEIEKAKGKK